MERECKEYYYNLGRVVALVEMMESVNIVSSVQNCPLGKLPIWLNKALANHRHNLNSELKQAYESVKDKTLQSQVIAPVEAGKYWIGYYHEKKFVDDNYKVIGEITTTISHHIPTKITMEASDVICNNQVKTDNVINELRK